MKVKELIKQLKKYSNEDDEIIVAYWDKDDIDGWYQDNISNEQWKKLVNKFDYYSFQQVCDDIDDIFCNEIKEETND